MDTTKSPFAEPVPEHPSPPPRFLARKVFAFPDHVVIDIVGDPEDFKTRFRKVRNEDIEILLTDEAFLLSIRREMFIAIPFGAFDTFKNANHALLCVSRPENYVSSWLFTLELDQSALLKAEGAWRYRQAPSASADSPKPS